MAAWRKMMTRRLHDTSKRMLLGEELCQHRAVLADETKQRGIPLMLVGGQLVLLCPFGELLKSILADRPVNDED